MVTIREKKLKNKISLYLDIYIEGKRKYEFLKIYIIEKPKNQKEKLENKENRRLAEAIRSRKEVEIINNKYKLPKQESSILFLDYFKSLISQKRKSQGNRATWDSSYKILQKYFENRQPALTQIDELELNKIKSYFIDSYKTKSGVKLSANSAHSYFNKVKACLNQAFDEKLISDKIGSRIKAIKPAETHRNFLTIEEIQKLENVDCDYLLLKNAFLFSVYTGLRWSDVVSLRWENIKQTQDLGNFIQFTQQKTKGAENLPIPKVAMKFIGEKGDSSEKVFQGLKYSAWNNLKLSQWVMRAGIDKKITFHSARHTYATILLSQKVDYITLMKLLGHRNIRTTLIYAKVIDHAKIEAINILDNLKSFNK